MRLGYGLTLEQSQKLVMTPELRQAIAILQMSAVELSEYVEQEMIENPCLEVLDDETKAPELTAEDKVREKKDDSFDIDWQEYFADTSDLGYAPITKGNPENEVSFEQFINLVPSLQEHLLFQLSLVNLKGKEKQVGQFLIGNIDDNGYLCCAVEEVAKRYGISVVQVEEVLRMIHGFEPAGVGARNLVECLLIQLDNLEVKDPLIRNLVTNYLNELGKGKLRQLAKKLQVPLKVLQQAIDYVKSLDPKPGRKFGDNNNVRYIVPDIVVERVDNEYVVLVNDTSVPRLGISNNYRHFLNSGNQLEQSAKKYVEGKLNSASWLIKSIEQRRLTLYKVASCIVELQRDFLERGVKYLKPLNLKHVAEKVDLHESTVSRATANKYMQTTQGLYELKFFFTSGVDNEQGEMVSSESVKKHIRDLIQEENTKKPLSDQKISEVLTERGINISRRTVAKYRGEMGILAASKRKRY